MAFNHFKNDPKGYSRCHKMFLNNSDTGAGSTTHAAPVAVAGGNHRQLFTWNGTHITLSRDLTTQPAPNKKQKIGMALGLSSPRRDYSVAALGAGPGHANGFRYLPFRANHVTYMQMDAAADFCITGPLTGCTVAAGKDAAGTVWFFHANENNAHGAAARLSQNNMILAAAAAAGVPAGNLVTCVMTVNYNGMAFVFGRQKPGNVWKFYVVDRDFGGGTTNKFGQI